MMIAVTGCSPAQTVNSDATQAQIENTELADASDGGSNPAITSLGPVTIDVTGLASAQPGDAVELNLGAAGSVAARTVAVDHLDGGRISWRARTIGEGVPDGEATLIIDGAAITGSVRTPEGVLYRIKPSENGNTLERVDTGQMPPD